jgi:hypothetical protein
MGKQLFIKLKVRCSGNIKINLKGVQYCMEDIYCKIKGMYMYVVRTVLASMAICSWKTVWVIILYKIQYIIN